MNLDNIILAITTCILILSMIVGGLAIKLHEPFLAAISFMVAVAMGVIGRGMMKDHHEK